MKPPPFAYHAPRSLSEVLELLGKYGSEASLLAGGQSLIPALNFRLSQPAVLIDLNRVPELSFVQPTAEGGLHIGAMTRQRHLERDPLVRQQFPLLETALYHVAHPQIRNRGTVGGSLAHADPAAELPALALLLEATFRLQSQSGERALGVEDFFQGMFSTARKPEELLVEVTIPPWPGGAGWGFREVARRHGDYALVGVAVLLQCQPSGLCQEARIALFSVGDRPLRARQAEQALHNQVLTEAQLKEAARLAAEVDIDPPSDVHASAAFRRFLTRNLVRQALEEARKRCQVTSEP